MAFSSEGGKKYSLDLLPSSSPPRVGDPLLFEIQDLSSFSGSLSFEKQGSSSDSPSEGESWLFDSLQTLEKNQLRLIPLKSGKLKLPPFKLKTESGEVLGETKTIEIEVQSGISPEDPHPDQPEGLLPPVALEFPVLLLVFLSLLVACLLGGLTYALFTAWKKRRPSSLVIVPEKIPEKPEHEVAFAELEELQLQGWIERGDYKKYYFRISEIFKTYLGRRYGVDALESTSSELIHWLQSNSSLKAGGKESSEGISYAFLLELEGIFSRMDWVKFTDALPEMADAHYLLSEVRDWIQKTKRQESEKLVGVSEVAKEPSP